MDHKNLVYKMSGMTSECILRWHLILKEYNPDIHYVKGEHNSAANALSYLKLSDKCYMMSDNLEECFGPTLFDENFFSIRYSHNCTRAVNQCSAKKMAEGQSRQE